MSENCAWRAPASPSKLGLRQGGDITKDQAEGPDCSSSDCSEKGFSDFDIGVLTFSVFKEENDIRSSLYVMILLFGAPRFYWRAR